MDIEGVIVGVLDVKKDKCRVLYGIGFYIGI